MARHDRVASGPGTKPTGALEASRGVTELHGGSSMAISISQTQGRQAIGTLDLASSLALTLIA